jgi:uncharacterized RDD family membrane protein YckC
MSHVDPQDNARFAPPRARVADVASTGAAEMATRGSRFWAVMIDLVLILVVMGVVAAVQPWNPFKPGGGYWSFNLVESVFGLVVFVVINGHLLQKQGQTVGKMLLKIRIEGLDGSPVTVPQLAKRYGIGYVLNIVPAIGSIYGLIDTFFIFRESRRCVHDLIADTVVVKA